MVSLGNFVYLFKKTALSFIDIFYCLFGLYFKNFLSDVYYFCSSADLDFVLSLIPLDKGSATPSLQPVRNQATQQEVNSKQVSEASSAAPHCLHYHLNHPPHPQSMEKLSSMKPVPVVKKVGDHCSRQVRLF